MTRSYDVYADREIRFLLDNPHMSGEQLGIALGREPNRCLKKRERLQKAQRVQEARSGIVRPEVPDTAVPSQAQTNVLQTDSFAVFGDMHVPHQDGPFIANALALARSWKIKHGIINGDLFEHANFKRHPRRRSEPILDEEIDGVTAIMPAFVQTFDQTDINLGNHEWAWLLRELNSALATHHWSRLFTASPTVRVSSYSFLFVHGSQKWVVGHPGNYSKQPTKAPLDIHLENYPNYHVVGAHNHQSGIATHRNSLGVFYIVDPGICHRHDTMRWTQEGFNASRQSVPGILLVKDNYPHLVYPWSPWEALHRLYEGVPMAEAA